MASPGPEARDCALLAVSLAALLGAVLLCQRADASASGPRALNHNKALFLTLRQAPPGNASSVVRRTLHKHPLRRNLADARMWLYGHVLTEGYYYTMLGLGTPPQQFALIVDTGSTVTYVPCKSCTHCGPQHQDKPYVPASSSSYQEVACSAQDCPGHQCGPNQVCAYSRHYAEDSTSSGLIASDLASFGDTSTIPPTRILFGCETSETGDLFSQRADGIIGMGKGALGIVNQLVAAGATEDHFSLCYGGMERGGGAMILGAVPSPPEMRFVQFDRRVGEGTYYNVAVEGIHVAGQDLQLPSNIFNEGYGSVLDSGTTFTYLPKQAFQAVRAAVLKAVAAKGLQQVAGPDPHYDDVCFGPASEDPAQLQDYFPPITFVFRPNVTYELSPENFLFRHTSDQSAYCLGLFENKDKGTLLGGILVRNTMVTYDRSGGKVGFWKTNCSDLFETLTKQEGAHAPPLPSELTQEPPSDVPPAGEEPEGTGSESQDAGQSSVAAPAETGPGCQGCAAKLEIVFRVSVSSDAFGDLEDFFSADVARELSITKEQVDSVTYQPTAAGAVTTDVHFFVIPPPEAGVLEPETVQRIQQALSNTEFSLRDAFGAVSLQAFIVVPPQAPPPTPYYWYIVAAAAAAVLLGIILCVICTRRARTRLPDLAEEERREEKAALADSGEHEHQPSDRLDPHDDPVQDSKRPKEGLQVETPAPPV